jgi:hypothetical protein
MNPGDILSFFPNLLMKIPPQMTNPKMYELIEYWLSTILIIDNP